MLLYLSFFGLFCFFHFCSHPFYSNIYCPFVPIFIFLFSFSIEEIVICLSPSANDLVKGMDPYCSLIL